MPASLHERRGQDTSSAPGAGAKASKCDRTLRVGSVTAAAGREPGYSHGDEHRTAPSAAVDSDTRNAMYACISAV